MSELSLDVCNSVALTMEERIQEERLLPLLQTEMQRKQEELNISRKKIKEYENMIDKETEHKNSLYRELEKMDSDIHQIKTGRPTMIHPYF